MGCKSPLETLYQFYPDIRSSFNVAPLVFGCTAFVHIHNHNRGKLDHRALKCVFMGYSSTQKGYKCYHPPTRKIYVSVDVTFVENKSYFSTPYLQGELSILEDEESAIPPLEIIPSSESFKSKETTLVLPISLEPIPISQSKESIKEKEEDNQIFDQFRFVCKEKGPYGNNEATTRQEHSTKPSPGNEVTILEHNSTPILEHDLPIALRKGTRECTKSPLYLLSHFVSFQRFSLNHKSFLSTLNTIPIPNSLSEALSKREWRLAMEAEMDALQKNETWELVDLPSGKKPMACKWVFAVKFKGDGSLERYKATLVAKGYSDI